MNNNIVKFHNSLLPPLDISYLQHMSNSNVEETGLQLKTTMLGEFGRFFINTGVLKGTNTNQVVISVRILQLEITIETCSERVKSELLVKYYPWKWP